MPELPEVETVVRELRPLLVGGRLVGARSYDPKFALKGKRRLIGQILEGIERRGKFIILQFEKNRVILHLGMSGRLVWEKSVERKHLRLKIEFEGGSLYLIDIRKFGGVWLDRELELGVEPLSRQCSVVYLREVCGKSRRQIKTFLLEQGKIAGLGNIYVCEALFEAGIDPARPANSLTSEELKQLQRAIRKVLQCAIRACGTSFSDFRRVSGEYGGFGGCLKVYGKEGEPCARCGREITRIVQQQRSTFWCRGCQR